ncbi:FAD:protein FMN transferase [Oceaniserpentilla sp. 4NH20-0058]|uniref:FAD:protein FMN transferase n=1 Tax=Oceaniserpentilla sp. 4NH20-0058 TaxID=3127660 RepID=UPI0031079EAC
MHQVQFQAMASPCQVLIEAPEYYAANAPLQLVANEAWRIEQKFSRYRDDNLLYKINHHETCTMDEEFMSLMNFADQCFHISDGLFDVTSGALRRVWNFKTMKRPPEQSKINEILPFIGWEKVIRTETSISLPKGMEIDLGGIGKEYAVDKCWQIMKTHCPWPFLINFGGDLRVSGPRANNKPWRTGIENADTTNPTAYIDIRSGAITTSGTTIQYFEFQGKRYGHILNPKTGWPVENPPRSISIAAGTCIEAGILSTLAMLQGDQAKSFLETQGGTFWLQ